MRLAGYAFTVRGRPRRNAPRRPASRTARAPRGRPGAIAVRALIGNHRVVRAHQSLAAAVVAAALVLGTWLEADAQGRGGGRRSPGSAPAPAEPAPPAGEFGFNIPDARDAVERGQGRAALAFYESAAAEAEARGDRVQAARAHSVIATVTVRLGMFQRTIRAATRALELLRDQSSTQEVVTRTIGVYGLLGSAYRGAGDHDQARRYFSEGLAFARGFTHLRQVTQQMGNLSRNLAQAALQQGNAVDAQAAALEAAHFFETFISRADPRMPERAKENARRSAADALILVARTQLTTGKLEEAEKTLAWAQGYARLVASPDLDIDLLGVAANVALARKDLAHAVSLLDQALGLAQRLGKPQALIRLHQSKARALLLAADRAGEALASIRTALTLVEEVRGELQQSDLRSGYLEDKAGMYQLAVGVALRAGQPDEAFAFAERGRARAFLDLLGSQTTLSKGKTRALVQEEVRLRARLGEARALAQEQEDGSGEDRVRAQVEAADREYRAFLERVRKENLEQASLMSVEPVTLAEIQRLLPEGTTLLEYFIADQGVVVWVVDRQRAKVVRLPGNRAALVEEVRQFRTALAERAPLERIEERARALHDRLLTAARAEIRGDRLLIVPHDVLHYLPFGALRSGGGKWLMEDYALATLPSASVLKYLGGKGGQAGDRVLAVGNPDVGAGLNLRYAEREARLVGQRYPGSTVLVRAAATEAQAKALLPGAGLVHFALHADLSEDDPLSSALLLVPGGGEDGRLEVRELFGLELNARLVVLSACETGLGKLSRGDELVGLQRAFLYAGTPAVVTTLWKVDDRASYELMREFYDRLKAAPPADALRGAQRAVLTQYPHPFAWAAFGVTGAP